MKWRSNKSWDQKKFFHNFEKLFFYVVVLHICFNIDKQEIIDIYVDFFAYETYLIGCLAKFNFASPGV